MSGKQKYNISRWCKYYERNDVLAIFHSLTLDVAFISSTKNEFLTSFSDDTFSKTFGNEIFNKLKEKKMIVPVSENDMQLLIDIRDKLQNELALSMIYLLLTDGCNLKCDYCFEDVPHYDKSYKPQLMTSECVEHSIEYFAKLLSKYGKKDKQKIVQLYGGEPMLNPEGVKTAIVHTQILKRKRILPDNCDISIVTNGTLLDEDFVKFFAENDVTVGLSLDGPKNINNAHRIFRASKSDVFKEVLNAYELIRKHKVRIGFSATLSPEAVYDFEEVIDFFVNKIGIQDGICFNILHYYPTIQVDKNYFNQAAKSLIGAFEIFREKKIYEERIMRKAKAFAKKEVMFSDCGVNGGQIVVSPEGRIGVCQDFVKPRKYFGGSVYESGYDPYKANLFSGWRNRSPLFMEQCYDCEAIAICGGGCPAGVELKTGNRWNVDDRICPHSKLTLEWLIWDMYAKIS